MCSKYAELRPLMHTGISDFHGKLSFPGDPEFKGAYLVTMERIPDEALANTDGRIDALQEYVKKQREKDSKPDAFGRKYRGE